MWNFNLERTSVFGNERRGWLFQDKLLRFVGLGEEDQFGTPPDRSRTGSE
jgi:hypothetical protein